MHGKIGKDYGWEFYLFKKWGAKYNVNIINLWCDYQRKGDHSPALSVGLVLLTVKVFEISIYNVHHRREDYEDE